MNSRERILAAVDLQPVDHVPLLLRFWPMGNEDRIPFEWRDQLQRARHLTMMGLDDTLVLQPPLGYIEDYRADLVPGVSSTVTQIPPGAWEEYPVLRKVYRTLAGELVHEVRRSADWIYGEDVPLFSDYNVSRAVRHAATVEADLGPLAALLGVPSEVQLDAWHREAGALRAEATALGVALDGGWIALADAAVMLCGMERILFAQMDEPGFVERLLDLLLAWELGRMDRLLAEGVDMIVHMAWYEGTDFWTPANWRRFLKPRLRRMVERAHAAGARYRYILTKGVAPLLDDIADAGVDCLMGLDPVQDTVDLRDVKRRAGSRLCLMGGVNSAVMLARWSPSEIDRAVAEAVDTLSPGGGFILFPVDAIFSDLPWANVEALIGAWRRHGGAA